MKKPKITAAQKDQHLLKAYRKKLVSIIGEYAVKQIDEQAIVDLTAKF